MKTLKKFIIVSLLLIIYVYVCYLIFLPSNYIIIQGEKLEINTLLGINLVSKEEKNLKTVQAVSNINKQTVEQVGKIDFSLNLLNLFKIKDVSVNVIPKTTVVPVGVAIGMKLYTDGVLVVGMSEIEGEKPYEGTGIQEGDRIIQINESDINTTEELMQKVNNCNGEEINIKYIHEEKTVTTSMVPVKNSNDEYKLGLWVRDAAAGVGTLTFYEPSSGMFACLGHGILDVDTSELITIANGELVTTNILSIQKGKVGTPGEIRGTIEAGYTVGQISKNTEFGVYGILNTPSYLSISNNEAIEVATREEIESGEAQIICELENGKKKYYTIEIQKIFTGNNENNKSMLIKVTDEELLEKTGGIIQGMSGAPIIQNGKFIGAITHVLVNDPTMGYGVFADIMIKQMKQTD